MTSLWDMPQLPAEDELFGLPSRDVLAERKEVQHGRRAEAAEDPWRSQPAFGAARSRRLGVDPSFSVLRRPQPAEDDAVPAEALGFVRQVGAGLINRPGSPVSVVLSDRIDDEPELEDAKKLAMLRAEQMRSPVSTPDEPHRPAGGLSDEDVRPESRESAIASVVSSMDMERWQELGGPLAASTPSLLQSREASRWSVREESSRLSILEQPRRASSSQQPDCYPGKLPKGLIVDQQSASESEIAGDKRDFLYTEERVGRSKSKEELACYRGAANKVKKGAKLPQDRPARAGRRARAAAGGPRSRSAMAVLESLEAEKDPPLADLPFPWVKKGSDPWLDGVMAASLATDSSATGTVAVLDAVLKKDTTTTKPSENVYIHKASQRQRRQSRKDRNKTSSVPLTVEKLNTQDYILTTDGVVAQTGNGQGEFMSMPEWLQESTYLAANSGNFNLWLWSFFNKLHHVARRQKFLRTRRLISSRALCFRQTFRECLRQVCKSCASEATQPPGKLLQPKRHGRCTAGEFQKIMKEQRVLAHESFVEMMEKLSRLVERVISEVKAGEMRKRAKQIEQAQIDEINRWRKHGKDAAKIPGMPGSQQYGPNNRLHPKPPRISALHKPLEEESDTALLPRFIRLCDYLTAFCVTYVLENNFENFIGTLKMTQGEAARNMEYFRAAVTFTAPPEVVAQRKASKALAALGAGSDEMEQNEDGSWSQVYFEPRAGVLKQEISTAMEDFVAIFDAPRLLYYEAFQDHVKKIVSFHDMNQVQGIHDIVPAGFVDRSVAEAHAVVADSFAEAKKQCLDVFDSMDEFWLFARNKIQELQASTTVADVAQLPGTLRMCHQWRERIAELGTRKHGTHVSKGMLWVDGTRMEKELNERLTEVFHEVRFNSILVRFKFDSIS